ncbi:MAG TPA: TAXI family TRAP transporter solute-binding subunit [Solirubrobacterales bacterium]|nr:TAXI family TRAP transporter solute-binding subunit [Solirubrobacterales bacterium]
MTWRRRPSPVFLCVGLLVTALACLLLTAVAADAQLPREVTLATNPPGTTYYAVASGLAKVVSGAAGLQMVVQPYTGTSTMLPLLATGEADFGLVNAVDVGLAYRGPGFKIGGRNPFQHAPSLRLVMRGSPLLVALLVRKDSPIRSVHDVRGKRMTGEYPAHLAVWYNMFGHLASAGLSWEDVKIVPVPAVNDGVDALVQGRADVTAHALGSAKVKEADSAVGVRHVSIDCSPEGEKRLRTAVPGYYPRWVKAGSATAIVEDTCFIAYDSYLAASENLPDPVVEAVLKALWDNESELWPIHPLLREWTRDRAVGADVTIPYHPAAVRFYKGRGVWRPERDQLQQNLLSLAP